MASWRSTMAPPSARTAVSPLAVATGCFSAAIRAAKRLRCCEASSRLATAAVLSPSPGSATCCPEFRRTPSRGLVNYCPTAGNRSLVQPRSELRLYHSIHATGMRFTSRLPNSEAGLNHFAEPGKNLIEDDLASVSSERPVCDGRVDTINKFWRKFLSDGRHSDALDLRRIGSPSGWDHCLKSEIGPVGSLNGFRTQITSQENERTLEI